MDIKSTKSNGDSSKNDDKKQVSLFSFKE